MRRVNGWALGLMVALFSTSAFATHFRYGTITWRIPNPGTAPRTVEFTVTTAWRAAFVGTTNLNFGDGQTNGANLGTSIGTGTDTGGNAYDVRQYTATRTYAGAATSFTAFFADCCRVSNVVNGADGNFRVESVVDLQPGSTGGPISGAPAIIQMQFGNTRIYDFPIADPDGDPTSCRFATAAESGLPAGQTIPSVPVGGAQPVLSNPAGLCRVTWNLTNAVAGQFYVLHLVLESTRGAVTSRTAVDLIVEIVTPPPPVCTGSITQFLQVGQAFSRAVTGTHTLAGNLTLSAIGMPAGATLTPAVGTSGPSPYSSTFAWTPAAGDLGTSRVVTTQFTNSTNASGACFLTLTVLLPPPTITTPANGAVLNTGTPLVSGTAPAGATVRVTVAGTTVCTAVANGAGAWSCTPAPAVADGSRTFNAVVVPLAGAPSAPASATVTIDTAAPDTSITAQPAATSGPNVSFSFTGSDAAPSSGLAGFTCTLDGVPASCTSPRAYTGLSNGSHTFTVVAIDAAGNVDSTPATYTWTVDAIAPAAPVISAPAAGAAVATTTPALSGTAEAGSTVTVREGATVLCTAVASGAGAWSCTPGAALTQGPHTVTATATDAVGNVGPSASRTFTVDTVAPDTSLTAQPPATSGPDVSFSFTGSDAAPSSGLAGFTCTMDGTPVSCTSPQAYTGLSNGSHTFTVAASDAAGNVDLTPATYIWTVDAIAPAAPVISAPTAGAAVATTTPALSGTAEAGSTVTVREGATVLCTAVASGAGAWSCTPGAPLAEGPHTVTATATDAVGNVGPSASRTFTVDTVAPDTSLTAQPPATSGPDVSFSFTGSDAAPSSGLAGFTCTMDGTPVSCTSPQAYTGLSDGSHTFTVAARDAAGNVDLTPASYTWTVDAIAPAAPAITTPADGGAVATTTPALSGTAEAGSTVTVREGATVLCTAVASGAGAWSCTPAAPLAEGPHTVTATATDAVGNVSPTASSTFTVDTAAPDTSITSGPAAVTNATGATFVFTGTDAAPSSGVVSYQCTLDGMAVPCTSPQALSGLADGPHTFTVAAVDAAGNVDATPASMTWTVDTAAPASPTLTSPVPGTPVANTTPLLTGTGEPGATITVTNGGTPVCSAVVDGSGNWTCTPTTPLPEGDTTVTLVATDPAGNPSPPVTSVITVDTTAPAAPVITAPTAGAALGGPAVVLSGTAEANSRVEVTVDGTVVGTATADASGNWTLSATLADGNHSATATARDAAGNTGPASVAVAFTTAALDTTIVSGPLATSRSTDAAFDFSSSVAGVTYECSLDGGAYLPCTDPVTFTGFAQGAHLLAVRAVDSLGNVDPSPAVHSWSVDSQPPPAPAITAPTSGQVVGFGTPAITGTAEPGATVTVVIDGVVAGTVVADSTGSFSFTPTSPMADGPHTVAASATDAAGNTGPASPTVPFTVDTSALDTAIASGPSGAVSTASATFDFTSNRTGVTYECSLDGGAYVACSDPVTFSALADGSHTLLVRANDGMGSVDATPAARTWVVDTAAPAAPVVTSPADGATISTATPTITGTAEAGATVDVRIDGVSIGTVTANAQGRWSLPVTTALAAGSHTVNATATDAAGNTSASSATHTFSVDTSAIDTFILSGPPRPVASTSATFDFDSNRPGATYECSVDGAAFAPCGDPVTFTGLAEGDHRLEARASEGGQTDSSPAVWGWTIDTVGPAAPVIVEPANNTTVLTGTPIITGTAEPGAIVTVTVDGMVLGTTTAGSDGRWTYPLSTALTDGPHTTSATATDAAGNVSPASADTNFIVLTATLTPPAITAPTNGAALNTATPTVTGTAPPGSTVTVTIDGVVVGTTTADGSGNWSLTLTAPLGEGAHVITATASDGVGRMSGASAPVSVTVDTVAPETTIDSGPAPSSPSSRATVTFSSSEPGVTFHCSLDGAPFAPCASPQDYTGLGFGDHELLVRATDAAGNTDATPARHVWRVAEVTYLGGGVGCSSTPASGLWPFALFLSLLVFLRRKRAAGVVVALALTALPASAQTSGAAPFELETLQLNASGQHSLLMNSGVLMPRQQWRVSFTGHLEHDPLVVRLDGQRVGASVADRVTAHLMGAFSPTEWLEVAAQLPIVVFQRSDDLTARGVATPSVAGLGTPWLDARASLLREANQAPVDLVGRLSLGLPFGSDTALARDPGLRADLSVSAGRTVSPAWRASAEVGFGLRPATVLGSSATVADEVGSGFRLAVGVNTTADTLGQKVRYEAMLRALLPVSRSPVGVELLVGARYPLNTQLEAYAIAGPGFGQAPGTPAFRVMAGVGYTGGQAAKGPCDAGQPHRPEQCPALDDDSDGVLNGVDACPLLIGPASMSGCPDTDADGLTDALDQCPRVAGPARFKGCPDSDGDGLADATDACPLVAGPAEFNGCPDSDGDGVRDNDDACPQVSGPAEFKGCPDSDGDGLRDSEDACPQVAGTAAFKGCPDSDNDGVADSDDACPRVAGPLAFKGCPDSDGDGLADAEDECPKVAGPAELKGCPDGDGDGVADRDDTCPKVAGVKENNGCPAEEVQSVVITREKIVILDKVYFATGKSVILAKSFGLLDRVAAVLVEHPELTKVGIEGHTDSTGRAETNRKLSQARANAVMAYLVKKGVAATRLEAKGYGPDQPADTNDTPEGRENNRRVEFKVRARE